MAAKDYDRNKQAAANVLASMSQDIARTFESYILSLEAVVDGYRDDQVASLGDKIKRMVLFDRAATQSDLGSIQILNPRHSQFTENSFSTKVIGAVSENTPCPANTPPNVNPTLPRCSIASLNRSGRVAPFWPKT